MLEYSPCQNVRSDVSSVNGIQPIERGLYLYPAKYCGSPRLMLHGICNATKSKMNDYHEGGTMNTRPSMACGRATRFMWLCLAALRTIEYLTRGRTVTLQGKRVFRRLFHVRNTVRSAMFHASVPLRLADDRRPSLRRLLSVTAASRLSVVLDLYRRCSLLYYNGVSNHFKHINKIPR